MSENSSCWHIRARADVGPVMHATTVGNPASRRNFALCRSLVVASVAVSTHASERPKRWSHGIWFGMRLTGRCRWSQPPSSRNIHPQSHYNCRVAGKGPCRVSGYSKSSRSSSTIVRISCRRNLNLYNSTSSYISSRFLLSRNTRFRFKFLLCLLLQTTTAAIFHHRLRVTPPS